MYRIDYDRNANCLAIHVAGFWRPADIPAFADALESEGRRARAASPTFNAIIHSLDFPVQANDVADMMTGVMARCIGLTEGLVAIVVASQINKMQVERTLVHPRVRPFLSEAEARSWLAEMSVAPTRRATA